MRILITGASGFIGQHLCRSLVAQGHEVLAVSRQDVEQASAHIKLDLERDALPNDLCAGCDAVIHLAARVHVLRETDEQPKRAFYQANVHATEKLAQNAKQHGVPRFVFVSTIGVNGKASDGHPFTAEDAPKPRDDYAESKWQAEQLLQQMYAEKPGQLIIIRPPLVYGPGVKANFWRLMSAVNLGLPIPLRSIRNHREFIGVRNLVDILERCITHPFQTNETFVVGNGEPISTPDLIRKLAEYMGAKAHLVPFPEVLLRVGGRILGRSPLVDGLCNTLEIDISKLQKQLAWTAPQTLDDGLKETVQWFLLRQ